MAKKKIVFVINNFWIGGVERLLSDLTKALSVADDVQIVTVLGSGPLEPEFKGVLVNIYHACPVSFRNKKLPSKIFWLILAPVTFIRLVFFLIKVKPDAVLTSLYHADVLGILAARLTKIQTRILIHHDVVKLSFLRKHLKFLLAFSLATRIVAVSDGVKEFLVSYWRLPQEKITVIYNGIDAEKFKKGIKTQGEDEPVFGIVGRLEPVKGHMFFLQALRILKEKHGLEPDVIFAGDGSERQNLEQYVKDNAIRKIQFIGFVTDVPAVLKKIDILAVPSIQEGFGLTLLEGLMARKVVVASYIDAFKELILPGVNGILFENNNANELADIFKRLILEPKLIEGYHRNIELWIQKTGYKYDIKNLTKEYKKLLETNF